MGVMILYNARTYTGGGGDFGGILAELLPL